MKFRKLTLSLSPLLLAALGSCSFGGPGFDLDRAQTTDDIDRMQRRMNVRLYREGTNGEIEEYDVVSTNAPLTAEDLAGHLATGRCGMASFGGDLPGTCSGASSSCGAEVCTAQAELCVAEELLSLAALAAPETITLPGEGDWLFSAQSVATKSALAREAYRRSSLALVVAGQALHRGMDASCSLAVTFDTLQLEGGSESRTLGEAAASAYLAALNAVDESLDLTHQTVTAVADAQLSDEASISDAVRLAATLPVGSRSELAHLNVGGFRSGPQGGLPALREIDEAGFCPEPRLSPQARQALQLLRLAAVPPRVVLDSAVDIDDLLSDWDPSQGVVDGLLPRLAVLLSAPHLTSITIQEFYEGWGLGEGDFDDARAHLANEIRAFGLSLDFQLPPQQVTASVATTFPLYAATRTTPDQAQPAYWAAVAGYEFDDWGGGADPGHEGVSLALLESYETSLSDSGLTSYGNDPGFNLIVDAAATLANRLVATPAGADTGLNDARNLLATHAASLGARRLGRIQYCWYDDGTTQLRSRVYLDRPAGQGSEVAMVVGVEGLDCAVRGHISGGQCDLSAYLLDPMVEGTPPQSTGMSSYWENTTKVSALDGAGVDLKNPLYWRAGDNDVVQVYFVERAGTGWASLGGALLRIPTGLGTDYRCETVPIVPAADERVRDAIAPSTTYCAVSAESCAGVSRDQRIPLENELTSDGTPTESSWRHYLELARQAADRADALGEDLIRSGLEMDMRAEGAIDELENLCGVSLNISGLGVAVPANIGGVCGTTSDCAAGYVCQTGTCVLDPVEFVLTLDGVGEANQRRLADCLGSDATQDWTALGNLELCFWWDGSDPTTMCERQGIACPMGNECGEGYDCINEVCRVSRSIQCPFETTTGTCEPPNGVTLPAGLSQLAGPATPLSFFIADPETPHEEPPDPSELPCEQLALLRSAGPLPKGKTREGLVREILSNAFMDVRQLQREARRLSWVPLPGDYSQIRVDGASWLSTGDPYVTPGDAWPCASAADIPELAALCPDGVDTIDVADGSVPFFCHQVAAGACSSHSGSPAPYLTLNRVQRARTNDLMARAVLAARIITGAGLEGVRFPYVPRTLTDNVAVARAESFILDPLNPAEPPFDFTTRMHPGDVSPEPAVWFGGGGVLGFDDNDNPLDETRLEVPFFDMNRGTLFQVRGPANSSCSVIPTGAEWSVCPYDFGDATLNVDDCIEIIDDEYDCDDCVTDCSLNDLLQFDRNLGVIMRAFGADSTDGTAPLAAASRAFSRVDHRRGRIDGFVPALLRTRTDLEVMRLSALTPEISDLTNYWRRSFCGNHDVGCDLTNDEIRTAAERCVSNVENSSRGQGAECRQYVGCTANYWGCLAEADNRGYDFGETFDGNRAFIAARGLTGSDVLNGLEVMCAAARRSTPGGLDCSTAPEINSVGDLFEAEAFLQCQAGQIRNQASRVLFNDLPSRAVSLAREGGASGAYGTASGEYAAATDELRAGLIQFADINSTITSSLGFMAADIRALRSEVRSLNLRAEISDLNLASKMMSHALTCTTTVAKTAGAGTVTDNAIGVAVAVCADAVAQTVIAARVNELEDEVNQQAVEQAFARFERSFVGHIGTMVGAYTQLRTATARIEAASTRLKNLQSRGRRALARALMLDSAPSESGTAGAMGRQFNVNTVMRRRHNTLRVRYEEAHRNAMRLAFIAKIALEQRLGMGLDEMTEPLTLLDEPPARWHEDICSMTGIDYSNLRATPTSETGMAGAGEGVGVPENYSGAYVGDYVRNLELTFESYSFDYPFQDGQDTSVMSLRDEIWGVRAACSAEVPNLLFEAGQLDAQVGVSRRYDGSSTIETPSERFGWTTENCVASTTTWPPTTNGTETAGPPPACLTAEPIAAAAGPIPASFSDFGTVPGYRVHFGTASPPRWSDGSTVLDPLNNTAYRHTPSTRLIQWLTLPAGRYRFSYYARQIDISGTYVSPLEMIELVALEDTYNGVTMSWTTSEVPVPLLDAGSGDTIFGPTPTSDWGRYYGFFDLEREATVGVAIVSDLTTTAAYRAADIAGLMVEDVTNEVLQELDPSVAARYEPRPFFNTSQVRERVVHACEDTGGAELRRLAFTRHCLGLCPDGYGECPGALRQHCYYETSFNIDPDRLQQVGILEGAGFAFGNFNYRVEGVGINLVGTGVRDCSSSPTPSTCYSSGNVAYSILHDGPYPVRNHRGGLYDAPLFRGRVERARAVAAERYLTNPLSSTDRGLVEPYMRRELNGRPMGGNFILRIWDDPGLVWENVEDVQILLDYRYWTRQE
ncbi:MAG: hypothetical protein EVA89_12625 [Sandaracinaceae bacterium]|nr:MAG: hypothetical protein EVA89_12625 [Sandaracinaceae bacterium]